MTDIADGDDERQEPQVGAQICLLQTHPASGQAMSSIPITTIRELVQELLT